MPRYDTRQQQPLGRGGRYGRGPLPEVSEPVATIDDIQAEFASDLDTDSPDWIGPAALAVLGIGGAALARNPAGIIQHFNNARRAAMLTGYAPLKSTLGNLGAVLNSAVERGSIKPMTQFLRPQTVKDFFSEFASGNRAAFGGHTATGTYVPSGAERWYNLPGRFMGAADEATGKALQRAGLSGDEAARELLQAPMDPGFAAALDKAGPVGQYLVPFPRIPFNQFKEGLITAGQITKKPKSAEDVRKLLLTLGQGGVGYVEGQNTEGAIPLGLGAAAAGRYGIPAIAGQVYGRYRKGGSVEEATRGATPFSEYGIQTGLLDPVKPFQTALERILSLLD